MCVSRKTLTRTSGGNFVDFCCSNRSSSSAHSTFPLLVLEARKFLPLCFIAVWKSTSNQTHTHIYITHTHAHIRQPVSATVRRQTSIQTKLSVGVPERHEKSTQNKHKQKHSATFELDCCCFVVVAWIGWPKATWPHWRATIGNQLAFCASQLDATLGLQLQRLAHRIKARKYIKETEELWIKYLLFASGTLCICVCRKVKEKPVGI